MVDLRTSVHKTEVSFFKAVVGSSANRRQQWQTLRTMGRSFLHRLILTFVNDPKSTGCHSENKFPVSTYLAGLTIIFFPRVMCEWIMYFWYTFCLPNFQYKNIHFSSMWPNVVFIDSFAIHDEVISLRSTIWSDTPHLWIFRKVGGWHRKDAQQEKSILLKAIKMQVFITAVYFGNPKGATHVKMSPLYGIFTAHLARAIV